MVIRARDGDAPPATERRNRAKPNPAYPYTIQESSEEREARQEMILPPLTTAVDSDYGDWLNWSAYDVDGHLAAQVAEQIKPPPLPNAGSSLKAQTGHSNPDSNSLGSMRMAPTSSGHFADIFDAYHTRDSVASSAMPTVHHTSSIKSDQGHIGVAK